MSVVEAAVEPNVIRLLAEYFSKAHREICRSSRLVEDLKADSVDIVEVVMIIEGAFNIELSSNQVAEWRSVVDIVKSIASGERMRAVIEG
ncbi:phosphopantetheine-binding protein [Pseudomonas sp. NFACC08-1]|uniref:phosphopantetheine-binding protein n=1 Tax=Pseudomonas sp. NFACC08-1 TaxID=1566238 RepID=UPI000B897E89|nr:phosphopantetheine-binding protein [Pseudomonas sp. NFACC08-1]